MKEILIGLAGRARTGKDTAATYLNHRYGLYQVAFATPIKDGIAAMFGVDKALLDGPAKEQPIEWLGISPRELMQTLGTQWGRMLRSDLWVCVAERELAACRAFTSSTGASWYGAVFSDVRFADEAAWIRGRGGLVLHLGRSSAPSVREHESEAGLPMEEGDMRLPNHGALDELYKRLDDIVEGMHR